MYISSGSSDIAKIIPIDKNSASSNISNPFQPKSDGSGMSLQELAGSEHIYTVHHHHAYIVVGQDIVELLLNPESPNFHHIHVDCTPIQIAVSDFGQETYLHVLYEREGGYGYVASYRKYNNRNWGKYGQHNLLIYSPRWFDVLQMSNVIFFKADDWDYSYSVMYVAVAAGYTIYFKELLDSFQFSLNIPEPCENIVSLNFNEQKQTLFVVCTNVTFYFDYNSYKIYKSSLWNRTGVTYFSQDGHVAAIATNHSGEMTTLTMHGLLFNADMEQEEAYQFQHFHHVASRSLIINGVFVTVSKTIHYFCYIELEEFGILCVDVEQAIMNVRNQGVVNNAMIVLPNTHSISCSSYAHCSVLYSHHSLLVAKVEICENDCHSKVMLFNMSTLENILNITGINLDMYAYKMHPNPILLSNITRSENETTPTATEPPLCSSVTDNSLSSVYETPTYTTTPPIPPTKKDGEIDQLLEICQSDLQSINTSYSTLLYLTGILCVCFCVAMVLTILLLMAVVCLKRRKCDHHDSKS